MTASDSITSQRLGRVFLSYSSADEPMARGIARVLRQAGITVYDSSSIGFGESLLSAITEGIENSDAIVIILSEASLRSEWVQVESSLAVGSALSNAAKIVLPVFIGVHRNIPSVLQDIKALRVDSETPSDQVGAAVLAALESATFRKTRDYLQDAIALQSKALRLAQEKQAAQLLALSAQAANRVNLITSIVAGLVVISLAVTLAILLIGGHSIPDTISLSLSFVAAGAAVASTFTALRFSIRHSEEIKTGGDER